MKLPPRDFDRFDQECPTRLKEPREVGGLTFFRNSICVSDKNAHSGGRNYGLPVLLSFSVFNLFTLLPYFFFNNFSSKVNNLYLFASPESIYIDIFQIVDANALPRCVIAFWLACIIFFSFLLDSSRIQVSSFTNGVSLHILHGSF